MGLFDDKEDLALQRQLGDGDRRRMAAHYREISKRFAAMADVLDPPAKERAKASGPSVDDRRDVVEHLSDLLVRRGGMAVAWVVGGPTDKAATSALKLRSKVEVMNGLVGLLGHGADDFWVNKRPGGILKNVDKGIREWDFRNRAAKSRPQGGW